MPYTPCPASADVSMNAQVDCVNPAFAGLKTIAVGIHKNDIVAVVRDAATKNQCTAISLREGAKTFVIEAGGEVAYADTIEEFDAATHKFNKTVTFTAPAHGAGFSSHFAEPLLKNRDGFVIILQRKDQNGDCSFPIIGLEKGATGSTGTLDYNDDASGGCHVIALIESLAPSSEITLFDTDYATTLEVFDALIAKSY